LACRSRRRVGWSSSVSFTTSATVSRSPRSRSTAAAAATSADSTARSASARAPHASSTSTVASSMRFSRASWSGSSRSRRSRAAFSLLSRARSRPFCARAAVLAGDYPFLDPLPRPHHRVAFTSQKQRRPPPIGHPEPTLLPASRRDHRGAHHRSANPLTCLAPSAASVTTTRPQRRPAATRRPVERFRSGNRVVRTASGGQRPRRSPPAARAAGHRPGTARAEPHHAVSTDRQGAELERHEQVLPLEVRVVGQDCRPGVSAARGSRDAVEARHASRLRASAPRGLATDSQTGHPDMAGSIWGHFTLN
jgi:hypothetical protein